MLQQQLGVSRGGDAGSPLLLLLLLLLLELGLQRRRMFGFSLLPKSGAGGNAGPLLSQVSPISHIRKFCNGEKQSWRRICFPNLFSSLEPCQRPLKHRHVCCMSWISNSWFSYTCVQKNICIKKDKRHGIDFWQLHMMKNMKMIDVVSYRRWKNLKIFAVIAYKWWRALELIILMSYMGIKMTKRKINFENNHFNLVTCG